MKKKLIIILIIFIFLIVGLSGCNEDSGIQSNNETSENYSDAVKMSNVTATTKWEDGYFDGVSGELPGINHKYPKNMIVWIEITGDIENIGSKPIDDVDIKVDFYDNVGNILYTRNGGVSSLYLGDSKLFIVSIGGGNTFFEQISDYKVEIIDVDFH